MSFGFGFDFGFGYGRSSSGVNWYIDSLGIASPSSVPTYTGAVSGRYVPDEEGIFVAQAGLVNALNQAIPPVAGGNIAAGPTLVSGGVNEALMLSAARTNKVTCRKRNPSASLSLAIGGTVTGDGISITGGTAGQSTLTVVDDTAALTALGLQTIVSNGKVYKANNEGASAFMAVNISGQCGNTNTHSYVIYARESTVNANNLVRMIGTGGQSNITVINSSTWTKLVVNGFTPLNADNTLAIRVQQGYSVYFILPGLHESISAPYYPVVDATDGLNAITMAASDLSYPRASVPPLSLADGFQFRARITPRALPTTDNWLWSDNGTNGLYIKGTDSKVYLKIGANEIGTGAALTNNVMVRIGCKITPSGGFVSLNGTTATSASVGMPTWGGTALCIGEKGDNSQYYTGEFNKSAESRFLEFRDSADANWYADNTF